jgi:hypothetical protein
MKTLLFFIPVISFTINPASTDEICQATSKVSLNVNELEQFDITNFDFASSLDSTISLFDYSCSEE